MTTTLLVPDIGDFKNVPVIEILVEPGDAIQSDDALLTLESDKATIDVPASAGGTVRKVLLRVGDTVSAGTPMIEIEPVPHGTPPAPLPAAIPASVPAAVPKPASPAGKPLASAVPPPTASTRVAHAGPSVRKFARELGIDLATIRGTGPKGRIQRDDVVACVRNLSAQTADIAAPAMGSLNVLAWPDVDFAKFGPVSRQPRSRIKKIAGANLSRNWVTIPHVTNQDEADVTELESFRLQINREQEKSGIKVSLLAFLVKACAAALREFPIFNASLDGDDLVMKGYVHIGFAADTPDGLLVPVIRDADKKGILDIAREIAELSRRAREGALKPEEMQGGCFSISSLGGIGGTFFTPIINAPEVAILGICKAQIRPTWNGSAFVPRLMLPLSLSWDHRVIDGVGAARFNVFLARMLADMRRALV